MLGEREIGSSSEEYSWYWGLSRIALAFADLSRFYSAATAAAAAALCGDLGERGETGVRGAT